MTEQQWLNEQPHRLCHAEPRTFTGHTATVEAVAFSPDGGPRLLPTTRSQDAETGAALFTCPGHNKGPAA
jgi:hypothetical protein